MDSTLYKYSDASVEASNELEIRSEACREIAGRIVLRHHEIGDMKEQPGDVLTEVSGMAFLVQSIEQDLSLEDWTPETLENLLKTSVDLAAVVTRFSEALVRMKMKRLAMDKGSTIGSEDGGRKSEVGGRMSEVGGRRCTMKRILCGVLCALVFLAALLAWLGLSFFGWIFDPQKGGVL